MKHSRLSDAHNCLNRVNYELQNFRKELSDVSFILPSSFNIEGFLTWADVFWDGLLADFMVQSRIKKNIVAVEDAINRVTAILRSLSSL